MGWGVWAHHMFASGIGPISVAAFSMSTMFIAVPTGVKIFNWLGTMWGGKLKFSTPMLFAVGLVTMFTIGGLSGVTHAVSPADTQQTDTYYIVAHFHYVLFGGALLGFLGGFYFWWPKAFGYVLNDKLGKVNFWVMLIGFNLTFGPMHILGLEGMPRRTYTYKDGYGLNFWNFVSTVGAFIIAASVVILLANIVFSRRAAKRASKTGVLTCDADPWDGRSLEWSIPSPAPEYNFDPVPTVVSLDDFWYRKYDTADDGRLIKVADGNDLAQKPTGDHVHLPSPSYWPLVLAFGLPIIGYGLIYNLWLCVIGGFMVVASIYGWVMEPADDPEAGTDDHHEPPSGEAPEGAEPVEGEHEEAALVD